MTINSAHAQGKWVGVCGELAGEVLAAPLLLGLGSDEFSMAPALIPALKACHSQSAPGQVVRRSLCQALALSTTTEVMDLLTAHAAALDLL